MNKLFYKLCFVLLAAVSLVSCSKSDSASIEPLRNYNEQYLADIDSIDKFIDTHYITVDTDYNVTFAEIPLGGTQASIRTQNDFPLDSLLVDNYDDNGTAFKYKIYFLKLREGTNESPSKYDSIHVAYQGDRIYTKTDEILPATVPKTYRSYLDNLQFDSSLNPVWFKLDGVVRGWAEILTLFKTGTVNPAEGPDPASYSNYGAGVMFLPSGLAYYGGSSGGGTIPSYSNLIFYFKLVSLRYRDQDRDGILSKDEVPYGSLQTYDPIDYDSDGDGVANMYDIDDDGDHVLTKNEIKDSDGNKIPYNIMPDCSGNTTDPERIRKYLDPSCN